MSVKLGTTLSPRESGDFIAEHSDHVSIIEDGIKSVAKMVSNFFILHYLPGAGQICNFMVMLLKWTCLSYYFDCK